MQKEALTRRDLVARGIARATATRWIAVARAEGRAMQVPVTIGSGAVRKVWAMTVVGGATEAR